MLFHYLGIIALALIVIYLTLRGLAKKPLFGFELFEAPFSQTNQLFETPAYSLTPNTTGITDPFETPQYGSGTEPILGEEYWIKHEMHKPKTNESAPRPYEGFIVNRHKRINTSRDPLQVNEGLLPQIPGSDRSRVPIFGGSRNPEPRNNSVQPAGLRSSKNPLFNRERLNSNGKRLSPAELNLMYRNSIVEGMSPCTNGNPCPSAPVNIWGDKPCSTCSRNFR